MTNSQRADTFIKMARTSSEDIAVECGSDYANCVADYIGLLRVENAIMRALLKEVKACCEPSCQKGVIDRCQCSECIEDRISSFLEVKH
jgi:hypothetical protein